MASMGGAVKLRNRASGAMTSRLHTRIISILVRSHRTCTCPTVLIGLQRKLGITEPSLSLGKKHRGPAPSPRPCRTLKSQSRVAHALHRSQGTAP